jgi:hypothetical protein
MYPKWNLFSNQIYKTQSRNLSENALIIFIFLILTYDLQCGGIFHPNTLILLGNTVYAKYTLVYMKRLLSQGQ